MVDPISLRGFISVDTAVSLIARHLISTIKLEVEEVDITSAVNRVLAEDVYATLDRPRENISAVDGYAVRAVDTVGASQYNPIELTIVGSLRAGDSPGICLGPGEAVRVSTGAPVPCGADAVLMDEDVKTIGNKALSYRPVAPGTNVIFKSEDFKKGDCIAKRGTLIGPAHVASMAANGIKHVKVYRKIRVVVLAVGDELVDPGADIVTGGEYNSSAYIILSALIKDNIFEPLYAGIVPDSISEVEGALMEGFSGGADLAITTGGTGIGDSDVIAKLIEGRGKPLFRGVKMRPGRQTTSSLLDNRLVLHFSGFPVAAWAGYELLLRPAISSWLNIKGFERFRVFATLTKRVPNTVGYRTIVRAVLKEESGELYVEPFILRGSGVLSSLLHSNSYILIPEDLEGFEKGSKVPVYLY